MSASVESAAGSLDGQVPRNVMELMSSAPARP